MEQYLIDTNVVSDYLTANMSGADNFTWKELEKLAIEFKNLQ